MTTLTARLAACAVAGALIGAAIVADRGPADIAVPPPAPGTSFDFGAYTAAITGHAAPTPTPTSWTDLMLPGTP